MGGSIQRDLRGRAETEIREETEEARERAPSVPDWLSKWLRSDVAGRLIRSSVSSPWDVYRALGLSLEGLRGKPGNVVQSAARPVLRLWREILEQTDQPIDAELRLLVEPCEVLGDAARFCPDPIFARDIRGEGWDKGRNRSQNVAAVCRLAPKEGSSGATWQERLEVARVWRDAGRPLTMPGGGASSSTGGGFLHRLHAIAGGGGHVVIDAVEGS